MRLYRKLIFIAGAASWVSLAHYFYVRSCRGQAFTVNDPAFSRQAPQAVGGGAGKNFAFVQWAHPSTYNSQTSQTLTPTAGHSLIILVGGNKLVLPSGISDTAGNTISVIGSHTITGGYAASAYIVTSCKGTTTAFSVTYGAGGSTDTSVEVFEFSGVTAVDAFAMPSTGANPTTASITTSATDMFMAFAVNESNGTIGTPFTLTPGTVSGTQIMTPTGQFSDAWDWLNSSVGFAAGTYTFSLPSPSAAMIVVALK